MVTVIIEPDPNPFESGADLTDATPELKEVKCKGQVPEHFFEQLVDSGAEWYLDLSHANDKEAIDWAFEDIYAKCLRALNQGKTVLLVGVPITQDELFNELWRFVEEFKEIPDLQSFSEIQIEVGSPCVTTEQFWPKLMD